MSLFSSNGEKEYLYSTTAEKSYKFENPKELKPVYEDKKLNFKLLEEDGLTYVLFGKKKYEVEITSKNQNKYEVQVNGVSFYFTVESEFAYERRILLERQSGGIKKVQIKAPMPGKIIDVMVEEGSEVHKGDSIVVLEAMKMQNEILSNFSGKIVKVNIKPEQNIMKDDVMIIMECS